MNILRFFKRRTKSKYADDKSVDDFERVVREKGLLSKDEPDLSDRDAYMDHIGYPKELR